MQHRGVVCEKGMKNGLRSERDVEDCLLPGLEIKLRAYSADRRESDLYYGGHSDAMLGSA